MDDGQPANLVFWCPVEMPDHVRISWDFCPLNEPGSAICFFAARGRHGGPIFDPWLTPRNGPYEQYHHGDLNALHVSYFRRRNPDEMLLRTCNLRKSHGFHLVAQGTDPIPEALHAARRNDRIQVVKSGPWVSFTIDYLELIRWRDPRAGATGPVLAGGAIGLRQMSPLTAEHADLQVERIAPLPD